jgi:D-arabinose 1-dehydrogenase-like Zn-dependent alcohol dehydrogenase
MKAAILPSLNSKWEIQEIETPKPLPNQVLIKINASGLCYTDVHVTEGAIPFPLNLPLILGHEPAGEIVEVGEGVTTRKKGDRVGVPFLQKTCGRCEWCQRGKRLFCEKQQGTGVALHGGHAEYMLAYEDATMLIPNEISYEQAAPIFCAGYTVYGGLRTAYPKPHERIAIVGIGGLGHLGIQYSKAAGFHTIALTHSKNKEELAYKLGADQVVTSGKDLKENGGADVILVTSNSYKTAIEAFQGLRPEGRWVLMGVSNEELKIDPLSLFLNRHQIMGSQHNGPEYLYEALDYVAKGKVKVMTETFSLDNIHEAYDKVANGQVRFRAVIHNK